MVERRAENASVVSSILTLTTKFSVICHGGCILASGLRPDSLAQQQARNTNSNTDNELGQARKRAAISCPPSGFGISGSLLPSERRGADSSAATPTSCNCIGQCVILVSMKINGKHACGRCSLSEPLVRFTQRIVEGRKYPRHLCTECNNAYLRESKIKTGYMGSDAWKRSREKAQAVYSAKKSAQRKSGTNRAKFIWTDSRGSDTKFKRDNDLSVDFIASLISGKCSYCGTKEIRMSLDRIDNSLGHLKSNVVASCIQCNYLRRDMPFEAWKLLFPGLRKARKQGLLTNWKSGPRKNHQGVV